jgi:uncharacterized protein (TIGR02246 family)
MTKLTAPTTDEAQIRALLTGRIDAVANKDADALTAPYADDVVLFDVVGPLQHNGVKALAERVSDWLSFYHGGIDYTIHDLRITAGEDVAFCSYLYRVGGTMTDGTEVDMWVRSTVCLCKVEGEWTITHEHTSVPFDGATGAASVDLQPV